MVRGDAALAQLAAERRLEADEPESRQCGLAVGGDRRGLPVATDGKPALPGLWFVGFKPTLGGQLREGSIAAHHVAAAVTAGRSGRQDSNLRLPPPKGGALPG